ncbi:heat intolerant 4-like protein [Tanacetum coccineum]
MADGKKQIEAFKRMAGSLTPGPKDNEYYKKKQQVKMLADSLIPGPQDIAYLKKKQRIMMLDDLLISGPEDIAYLKKKQQVMKLDISLVSSDVDEGELVTESDVVDKGELVTPGPEDNEYYKKKQQVKMLADSLTPGPKGKEYYKKKQQVKMLASDVDKISFATRRKRIIEDATMVWTSGSISSLLEQPGVVLAFCTNQSRNVLSQDAFEEGGVLHAANNVYLFSSVEESFRCCHRRRGRPTTVLPVVVAVVSPFPPTYKIGMYSSDGYNKVVEMKRLGMHWDPYIQIKNQY